MEELVVERVYDGIVSVVELVVAWTFVFEGPVLSATDGSSPPDDWATGRFIFSAEVDDGGFEFPPDD